jgi:FHA domain.
VSRCHAVIKFKDGHFILEDSTSKFGTLVKSQEKISVLPTSSLVVQIGRTVVSLSTKITNNAFESELN